MTMHMGDEFSRLNPDQGPPLEHGPAGEWPPPPRQPRPKNVTPRYTKAPCDWEKASADSTNMSMLEHELIQPEDL
jgi:hypothetical protein